MSERAKIRAQLRAVLRTDDAVDEFLVDYFSDIAAKRSASMTRDQKITLLIETKEVEDIKVALQKYNSLVGSIDNTNQKSLDSGAEEIVTLRQENGRLRQLIRDFEQKSTDQNSKPSISPHDALQRIQKGILNFDRLYNDSQNTVEHQWFTFLRVSLDGLESALGKYHDIACEFRYRSTVERQPTSLDYRSLLCAAEDILKQRIEENDRASQNYVTNYLTLAASLGGPARRF